MEFAGRPFTTNWRGRLHARKLGKKTIVTADNERAWLKSLPPLRLAGGTHD